MRTKIKYPAMILPALMFGMLLNTSLTFANVDSDGDGIPDLEDIYPWDDTKSALPIHRLPSIVEAEDYDLGGQGIAYFDKEPENRGGKQYRNDGVDFSTHSDGQVHVGWFARDEWMNYTVQVEEDAYYEFSAWLGSSADKTKHVELRKGTEVLFRIPFLSSTQITREFEQTSPHTIWLTKGEHTFTLAAVEGSIRIDRLQFDLSPLSKDSDNDGVVDAEDAFPYDPTESVDTDSDGIGNNKDTDDDGDGVADIDDDYPLDSERWKNEVTIISPDSCNGLENQALLCNVLANDLDPEGDELTIVISSEPNYGTVTVVEGQILYQPNADFVGLDGFFYHVEDGFNRSQPVWVDIQIDRTTTIENPATIYTAGWENGLANSGLPGELTPSFSSSYDSLTKIPASYHYYEVAQVDWARTGNHVMKFYGEPPAYRSETAFMDGRYQYAPGDDFYFSASIRPDASWQTITKYSIILAQWKSFSSGPHAAVRLSNDGLFKLSFHAPNYPVIDLGLAPQDQWTDIRIYFKKSLADDGRVKVWVNGELKLDRKGKNMLISNNGYTKIGMYTEIRSPRTIYFDNVSVSKAINRELDAWGRSPVDGIYNDSDDDGKSNGLDSYPFDPER
ncbi:heparin lyase I family protein [Vibrio mediterranei]|uniref:heparin lyase I family protein n=1 Tax=Vibrio mediterranei TaxID=689 RepID=UPI00148CF93D|nr:heparin lyase I family protein [Vibrio mediterranei]NOH29133.1 hypothetical protein [Vibrio mediterranei]